MNYMPVLKFDNPLTNQAGFYMIAESAERADRIIQYLKNLLDQGVNINEIDIDYTDISIVDMIRIKKEVEDYYNG